jgi:hypothetical protein
MPISYSRFIAREAVAVAALNAGINASYTALLWRSLDPLTLFGASGVAADLATTPMFIGLLSTIFGTAAIRKKLASGRVTVGERDQAPAVFQLLPSAVIARALVLAIACGILFAAPLWSLLVVTGDATLTLGRAVGVKVGITILLSLVIVPIVVMAGLADGQRWGGTLALAASPRDRSEART